MGSESSMKKLLPFTISIFFAAISVAQDASYPVKRQGIPLIKNYTSKHYNADPFNHDITQDNRGILYFANNTGVIEYDGINWKLLRLPNSSRVYSLTHDKVKNRVYVGGVGDFGYLSCDQFGQTNFVSLKSLIPKNQKNFKNVWFIFATPNQGIIFFTTSAIYILKQGKIQVLVPSNKNLFHAAFYTKNTLYVREWGKGLKKLQNDRLVLVPNGDAFANERIYALLPFDENKLMVVTRTKGLLLYDGKRFVPWPTEITSEFLAEAQTYFSKALGDQYFAIATLKKGVIILNKQGKIVQKINELTGLTSPYVNNLFPDKTGNLWITKSEGLGQVILNSPFSFYNKNLGLSSNITSSTIVDDKAYFSTMQKGFFALPWKKTNYRTINSFDLVSSEATNILDISVHQKDILLGYNAGIWIQNTQTNKSYKIAKDQFVWKFISALTKSGCFLAGSRRGLIKVFKKKDQWIATSVKNSTGSIPYLATFKPQQILASDDNGALSKITLHTTLDSVINQKKYDTLQGLPANNGNRVFQVGNQALIATKKGIYQYNEKEDRFEKHPKFAKVIGDLFVRYIKGDKQGNLWLWAGSPNQLNVLFLKKQADNSYQLVKTPFQKLKNTFTELGAHINPIDRQNVLFSSPEGAIHYDPSIQVNYNQPYLSLIRKVETIVDQDSLIFGGSFLDSAGRITHVQPKKAILKLPYGLNDLRFSFAATYYEDNDKLVYSHRLKGFDAHWSDWLPATQKEYTNLPEGKYTFLVKARNIYGKESLVASYSFKVLPPWYRTVWAYIGYVFIAAFLVWAIVKLNVRRLQKQKRKLEHVVQQRTAEVVEKNNSLRMQKEELETLNEQIIDQKQVIEKKNEDILASINYARRIQSAMLPRMHLIKESLDAFILYRPRDIVSGDFYWFADVEQAALNQTKKRSIIIAADCTGHGVPGAFVSMVGNELLNEIIKRHEVHEPYQILEWLNEGIKRVFQFKETRSRDGMDIAICAIDKENKTMEFAGAHNPIVYMQNNEMTVIKGDKISVGEKWPKKMKRHTNHTISIEVPTTFYLFSDGFQDQFGGANGKKFMRAKFYRLLHEASPLSTDKQQQLLEQRLDDWMGEYSQIDDILVLGVHLDL
ncbi:hypothetical protein BKI52_29895 [marine bacterium AO1-C]|nr:hypothetical protein BKI52_29895 [marine bacterium AO1-C]